MFTYAIFAFLPMLVLTQSSNDALEAKIFNEIDGDRDGKLTKSEHDTFYSNFDIDKNGDITKEEFKNVIGATEPAFVGHEEALYKLLDRDGNGKADKADIDAVFVETDSNKDGIIDKPEYHVVFKNILKAVGQVPDKV